MESDKSQEILLKLRRRLQELQGLGYMDPASAGTYEQTLLQIWQSADKERVTCFSQAETLKRQAAAAEAQGHAFTAMASIIYNIVNGFVEAGQKRLREDAEREAQRKAEAAEQEAERQAAEKVAKAATRKAKRGSNKT